MVGTHMHGGKRRARVPGAQAATRHPFTSESSAGNEVLAALPTEEFSRLRPHLHRVPLSFGDTVCEPNKPIEFVYFPNSGMVSMVATMRDGASVEVGVTGREGFIGTPLVLGVRSTPIRAIVQIPGDAFRIESGVLLRVLPATPHLERMLHRYAHFQSLQVAQAAACNRLHQVRERLSRWLLMSRDRTGSDRLPLTQEFLSHMLGCRRYSVTAAAGSLQKAGLIRCRRGEVRIVNRKELERAACECYGVLRQLSHSARLG